MTMKARPTIYRGVQMRSRLEAAFAEYVDKAGLPWEYEGNAYGSRAGQYLPDFITPSVGGAGSRVFHEIKPPNADFGEALARMHIVLDSDADAVLRIWTRDEYEGPFRRVVTCAPSAGCGSSSCSRPLEHCEKCNSPNVQVLPPRVEPWGTFEDHECSDCGWMVSARVHAAPTT